MFSRKTRICPPGKYLIVGQRDDTDDIVFSIIGDVPKNPKLTQLCRRALFEMGLNDPLIYSFLCMIYQLPNGGGQLVLDQGALRRYVHANYG
ncbi:hypothetical protein CKO28_02485 [Rhodovibrio sodomensis]|uniref:Uncharacterized protein n=1 Tax=Rhodovibrio sodomensis TaxID=1088 RepID=A0ABS1D921_9PROT|nr:hypothetical protein [Rhodovibrio sodomensis]MBK1666909.1 hypothetical protein [Rhodovibrio sodomensis]